jgi:RNA polymerase sigma-70 factor (ECF subfamily)
MEGAMMAQPEVAAGAGETAPSASDRPHPSSDAELLRKIAAGDLTVFDQLVDRYKRPLFNHIRRRVNDPHRAEDLTQEVFLRLFRAARADTYTGQARVVTWLFTIAGNAVTDHLRAEGLRASVRLARDEAESQDPSDAAAAREGESRVRRLLLELPEAQRVVVELHVLDGLSFADVAELVGSPIPTVKSRLVYALRKLKPLLEAQADARRQES